MKYHICYLISSLAKEGPVNVLYNIVKHIDFSSFKVTIVTFRPEKTNSRLEDFRKLPIQIEQLHLKGGSNLFVSCYNLRKLLKKIKPDLTHAHCSRSLYLMSFLPHSIKKVYTIHIYPGFQHRQIYGKVLGTILACLNNFFSKYFCDLPIGCAESIGWQYKKDGWIIKCIPNGCSYPVWRYNENEKLNLRRDLGLKEDAQYFVFVGRLSPEKNPDILLEAFSLLEESDMRLLVLGEGPMMEKLKTNKPGNVDLLGFTNKISDYLKASDFYISCSSVEGLANTLLESMSVGLPLLVSDIPSHREVMANFSEGEVGKFILPNADDIVKKIQIISQIDKAHVREVVQAIYEKKYTASIMSAAYQQAYMGLMDKS